VVGILTFTVKSLKLVSDITDHVACNTDADAVRLLLLLLRRRRRLKLDFISILFDSRRPHPSLMTAGTTRQARLPQQHACLSSANKYLMKDFADCAAAMVRPLG